MIQARQARASLTSPDGSPRQAMAWRRKMRLQFGVEELDRQNASFAKLIHRGGDEVIGFCK